MTSRALVVGGSGQVGTALRGFFDARYLGRSDLDLADLEAVEAVVSRLRPTSVINCAAYTAVDRAEDEPERASIINGQAVGALVTVTRRLGIPFVTYSTDYVFDGESTTPYVESSPTSPINTYGRSKLLGEHLALAAHPDALVIRTSWVISQYRPNFVTSILKRAREGPLSVVADQHGCPTAADDLARATIEALAAGVTGVLHLTGAGPTTWYDLARATIDAAGIDCHMEPILTADYGARAPRPLFSVLASERMPLPGVAPLPPWRASLPALVETLMREGWA